MGFLLFLLMQSAGLLILDNPYAQVIKNGAPCAKSGAAGCGDFTGQLIEAIGAAREDPANDDIGS